jgi:hypothetical protein
MFIASAPVPAVLFYFKLRKFGAQFFPGWEINIVKRKRVLIKLLFNIDILK